MKINNDFDLTKNKIISEMKDEIEKRRIRNIFLGYFILLIVIGGLIWLTIIIRDELPSWAVLFFLKIPTIILMIIALFATIRLIKLSWNYLFIQKREKKNEEE